MSKLSLGIMATAVVTASAALVLPFQNSDGTIARQFTAALNTAGHAAANGTAGKLASTAPAVSGSEEFWLSAMRAKDAAGLRHNVSIGDRLTLSFAGKDEVFEVEAVAELPSGVTYVGQDRDAPHSLIVTARKSGDAAGKLLRFVIEQTPGQAGENGSQARAL